MHLCGLYETMYVCCVYLYVAVSSCICVYMWAFVSLRMVCGCVSLWVCVSVCVTMCVPLFIYMCGCICMYCVYMWACVSLWECCVCVSVFVCVCVCRERVFKVEKTGTYSQVEEKKVMNGKGADARKACQPSRPHQRQEELRGLSCPWFLPVRIGIKITLLLCFIIIHTLWLCISFL